VQPEDELLLISRHGIVTRQRVSEIRVIGRATQGVRVMALDNGDVLMDVARVVPEDDNGNGTHAAEQPVALDEDDQTEARAIVDELTLAGTGDDVSAIADDTSRFAEDDLAGSDTVDDDTEEDDGRGIE
jgi:DNA gyrase/topoisomerase IV subunit A